MKKRDISIDILKFFSVFLIINSHMDILYPKYKILATGGAIGDTLFLFCSGYTLFLGKMDKFDNWYKKRISRIYPSVIICTLMSCLFLQQTNISILSLMGGEFIIAIMLYYILLYIIQKHLLNNIQWVFACVGVLTLLIYLFFFPYKYETSSKGIYGITTLFRWIPYFGFMLTGALIGIKKDNLKFHFVIDLVKMIISLILFYGTQFIAKIYIVVAPLQIITLIPLLGVVYYFYKICNAPLFTHIYNKSIGHKSIMFVSSICLESYLIQYSLFTDKINFLFPLNLLIMILVVLIVSFICKCLSRIFLQTFNTEPYNWTEIFKLY